MEIIKEYVTVEYEEFNRASWKEKQQEEKYKSDPEFIMFSYTVKSELSEKLWYKGGDIEDQLKKKYKLSFAWCPDKEEDDYGVQYIADSVGILETYYRDITLGEYNALIKKAATAINSAMKKLIKV